MMALVLRTLIERCKCWQTGVIEGTKGIWKECGHLTNFQISPWLMWLTIKYYRSILSKQHAKTYIPNDPLMHSAYQLPRFANLLNLSNVTAVYSIKQTTEYCSFKLINGYPDTVFLNTIDILYFICDHFS